MATRAEIEKKHENITWRCSGPLALSQQRRDLAVKAYDEAVALIGQHDLSGGTAKLRSLAMALDGYLVALREPGLSGEEATALADPATGYEPLALLCVKLIRWHRGCGADMTPPIRALPYDGREHVVVCERCGTEAKVTRPLPDEDRADAEAAAGKALDEALS